MLLGGCAAFTPQQPLTLEQQIIVACRSYSGTVRALVPFKPTMTPAQVKFVDDTNAIVRPACDAAFAGVEEPSLDILEVVRDNLRRMVILEQQRKGS